MQESQTAIILRGYDYLASGLTGFLTAILVFWVISPMWPMLLGMLTGMALGIVVLLLMIVCMGWIAGSFEIIMPGKIIAMIVGMGGGMWAAADHVSACDLVLFGISTGLIVAAGFHIYDRSLHGERL